MMRALVWAVAALPLAGAASAESYADFGKPEQCGTYAEASYDRARYFPGGEAGLISLTAPTAVRGLNALLFDGLITDEGASDPAGRILAARGPLVQAGGTVMDEVLVVVTEAGVRLLQRCP
ncbi:MAG: hypothetical protein Q8Q26_11015 [Pseudorhodobacter sp.]|nr:hypothetical protein [Pseudorhodobacter sp.]